MYIYILYVYYMYRRRAVVVLLSSFKGKVGELRYPEANCDRASDISVEEHRRSFSTTSEATS